MEFIDLKAQYRHLRDEIDEAISCVLAHGQYVMGEEVGLFERELGEYLGTPHVVSCANGTDALQMLYMALGVGPGDAVFCPDITFIATIEPAVMLGATPVFCDVRHTDYNLCALSLERQIKAVLAEGRLKPRVVVPIDFLGCPADYESIGAVCERYGMTMIEDAAQSTGGSYKGSMCGSFGRAAITSFFPAKPLGCYGDGGAVMTADAALADVLRSIRVHGKGSSKYDNVRVGMNSRLDTLQAAILRPKLRALKAFEMDARQTVARRYDAALGMRYQLLSVAKGSVSAYAQYALLAKDTPERERLRARLTERGIPSMVYYPAAQHTLKVFAGVNAYGETYENAMDYCARTLSLPMSPYLTPEDQERVIFTLTEDIR